MLDFVRVDIKVDPYTSYSCDVAVETFRGIPCITKTVAMNRERFTRKSIHFDLLVLEPKDFPHYISKAAEKKALEMG